MIEKVKRYLETIEIPYKWFSHPPVYTVEEAKKYTENIRGIQCKNLFLKDMKSKHFYLIILAADKKANMKLLGEKVKEPLKFANVEDLKNILCLSPGAVSPFGLINDKNGVVVTLIDKTVWESDFVSFHPNINTESLELTGESFQRYIKIIGNEYQIIEM